MPLSSPRMVTSNQPLHRFDWTHVNGRHEIAAALSSAAFHTYPGYDRLVGQVMSVRWSFRLALEGALPSEVRALFMTLVGNVADSRGLAKSLTPAPLASVNCGEGCSWEAYQK